MLDIEAIRTTILNNAKEKLALRLKEEFKKKEDEDFIQLLIDRCGFTRDEALKAMEITEDDSKYIDRMNASRLDIRD